MSSWFNFRKAPAGSGDNSSPPGKPPGGKGEATPFQPQPEKARKWFEHARIASAQINHAYALHCYAFGLKLDPGNMAAHQAMWEAAVQYFSAQGKPASGREIREIDGPGPVDKFAAAEFAWMKDLNNVSRAIEALNAAAKANQLEFGRWAAPRVRNVVFKQNQKSPRKKDFLAAKDAFAAIGAWDEAFQCGQQASQLDPTDHQLANELKELTAQRTIAQGGYAQTAGQEGGFRGSIRDADRQKALEEQESLSGGADTEARNLDRARKEYEANPLSSEAISRLATLLKRTPEGEEEAHALYMRAFKDLSEYRFKMHAGDLRISQASRELSRLSEAVAAAPDDQALREAHDRQRQILNDVRAAEYRERAVKYPTDKKIKFDLGFMEFERGDFEAAMPHFQSSKEDARFRVNAAWYLGRCFAAEGWHQEAIGEYRDALQALDASDKERELEIRYDLMLSLMAAARDESSLAMAKEAAELCSNIVRRNIGFRDVRTKRKEIDQLVRDLGGSGA